MILITSYYKTINEERNKEINRCLFNNYNNRYIEKIYLLNNKIFNLDFMSDPYNKIEQIIISNNENYILKYCDAVEFINENLKDKICILANSDIYFDHTIQKINNSVINNTCIALLRYDVDKNGNLKIFSQHGLPRDDSQDSWIFRSPLNVNLKELNFSLGTLGCDNIFANIIYKSKIGIYNPCFDIISIHLHNTEFRTYNVDNRLHGKYSLLTPCKLNDKKPDVKTIDY